MNIAVPVNGISSVKKINEKARLTSASERERADLVVWAISLTAAFIEHIDHAAV